MTSLLVDLIQSALQSFTILMGSYFRHICLEFRFVLIIELNILAIRWVIFVRLPLAVVQSAVLKVDIVERPVYTERKRFATRCEQQVGIPKNLSGSDIAFDQCRRAFRFG